jgi:quinol monooxygenase YgiN
MIIAIFRMEVLGEKLKEFLQTVPEVLSTATQQPGCISHHLCRDLEGENHFIIIQEWEDQSKLDAYWCSDLFGTFLGTFHLLKNTPTLEIRAGSLIGGMEALKATRSRLKSKDRKLQKNR